MFGVPADQTAEFTRLIAHRTKDAKIAHRTISSAAETVANKPAFREAFKRLHCFAVFRRVLWLRKRPDRTKQPYRIGMRDRGPFGLAGLWERWRPGPHAEPVETFTIITTAPNAVATPIHNRMPVVVAPADSAALEA